ncbi:TetR/AcrR family transcriptional regulator [Streptomyces geysiriensis]|uniref:TetR/AcrR family transcriptional regulator n=1 Tax=Streptomyces geysiriensis TaxID=68207 RepID=UPI001C7D3143|nr:TetR/AcrR family transcriptional regulator C-terminal domain-containing protein [Streptomyces geysiriensis]MBX4176423.1 TetR/AcrR family transcriptional regulator C-terminal domain-containing protein [Streptomyces geysiriensis]
MAKRAAKGPARAPRRADSLSKELIVQAAIEMLDSGGEKALTLRALTVRLSTGYGAIYHHVKDKNDLLATAADEVITGVMSGAVTEADPRTALRALTLGLFDAIDAHPWVGAEFSRQPWRPALLDFYEGIGRLLDALGVPETARFDAAGALVNYVLGVAAQNAANARLRADSDTDRETFLENAATRWAQVDPGRYPFVHAAVTHLGEHDDREQFLVGVDIFLAGISSLR